MANLSDDSTQSDQAGQSDFKSLEETVKQTDITRPVSTKEIEYLINRYPFLKIIDAQTDFSQIEELPSPELIVADTGWLMQDYGFYICASLGEWLYGNYAWSEEGEGGEGAADLIRGKGTLVKQAFDTAADMVALGRSHGWEKVYIVEGTPLMGWAAWVIAKELGLKIEGYEPNQQDQEKKNRLKRVGRLDEMGIKLRLY